MIRPNELTNPGERAAYARVEALFERLDRFSAQDLSIAPLPALDDDVRVRLLAEVESLADRLGRRELLDTALDHCRQSVLTRFVAELRGRYTGMWPTYDPEREAAATRAITDAVAAAVVEDHMASADAEALAGPARAMLGRKPVAERLARIDQMPGHHHAHASAPARPIAFHQATLAEGAGPATGGVAPRGAPSERDWAEADHGATVIDPAASRDGRRATTRMVGALAGAVLALVVAAAGFAGGEPLLGFAGLLALAAVGWSLFAGGGRD